MPKTKISEFSATPGNNTDIDGINIAEGCAPSGINDAIRELMAQLKDFQAGTAGDSFNGPIGATTPAAGTFTNLSASGTFALTGDQVQISEGGTGQTTANAAFNALAPSQASNAGKYLKTDGTNTSWDALDISTADITGTLPIANGGTGLTALGTGVQTALGQNVTGSGGIVLATSPTLVTPALGTPSSVTLTNATGLPLSTGVTGTLATTNGGTGLTSFTANGVVYASSSSALTTGSALTFNGTDLSIKSGGSLAMYRPDNATYTLQYMGAGGTGGFAWDNQNSDGFKWLFAGSEQMRLTSTGLGIGTSSPAYKLHIVNDTAATNTAVDVLALTQSSTGTAATGLGSGILFNSERPSGGVILKRGAIYGVAGADPDDDGALAFYTLSDTGPSGFTEKMRLDSSGNLGLGVTPSAWGGYRAAQIGAVGSVASSISGQDLLLGSNAFFNGTNDRYIATGFATRYGQFNGQHVFYTAASGTAGNAISFTQAMTLDASGNLVLGSTSAVGRLAVYGNYAFFQENASGADVYIRGYYGSANVAAIQVASNSPLAFLTNNAERARITSGGYFKASDNGVYAGSTAAYHEFSQSVDDSCLVIAPTNASFTSSGVFIAASRAANAAYYMIRARANAVDQFYVTGNGVIYAQNTTVQSISDGRLKENVVNATDGLNVINALRPVRYDWKPGYGNDRKNQLGFIAQEVEVIFPDAVSEWASQEDEEIYKTVGPGALIPVLVKAIQEQQAIITDLRARVAQLEAK